MEIKIIYQIRRPDIVSRLKTVVNWDTVKQASGKTDYYCKVKETLFIQELQPALNANVSSEKLLL